MSDHTLRVITGGSGEGKDANPQEARVDRQTYQTYPDFFQNIQVKLPSEFITQANILSEISKLGISGIGQFFDSSGGQGTSIDFPAPSANTVQALLQKYGEFIDSLLNNMSCIVGGPTRLRELDRAYDPLQWHILLPVPQQKADIEIARAINTIRGNFPEAMAEYLTFLVHDGLMQIHVKSPTLQVLVANTQEAIRHLLFSWKE